MYRDNEVSGLGEVLARKEAGDKAGLVAAAARLWLLPAKQAGEPDDAAAKVWRALEQAGAVPEAVEAGVTLLRARQLIRPHAFIDLVEHINDPALLIEIAGLVLDAGWPAHPYLAAVFLWLIESKQEDVLWAFIQQHRERLAADTPAWTLVGLVLTTSRIGRSKDVDDWFKDWERRADVPMWIVAAYAGSVAQLPEDLLGSKHSRYERLIEISRAVWAHCAPDGSAGFIITWLLVDHLRHGRDAEFLDALQADGAVLTATRGRLLEPPLVRYVNAARHRNPITRDELDFNLSDPRTRPVNWRAVTLLQELETWTVRGSRLLPLFLVMHQLSVGDPRAAELHRQMRRSYPSTLPFVKGAWKRFVKSRISWLTRLKLAFV